MNKKTIKKYLNTTFLNEENPPGLTVTNSVKKKSGKINKDGINDINKEVGKLNKPTTKKESSKETPNKFNHSNNFEKSYHDEMEIMNGQEMIQYDRTPNDKFSERSVEAIEGSSKMGNNPEWANVIPKQQGFTGPEFGKELVKKIKSSALKRAKDTPAISLRGKDIQDLPEKNKDNGHKPYAIEENITNNKDKKIKKSMKRLKFKNPFNGLGNALKLIPETYKTDKKVFEMTDGNEYYKIRWEGSLTEGKAVVLMANDKSLVNEDIKRMKALFGYKSQETLGLVKGKSRLDENAIFTDMLNKTKVLMTESEDMDGLKKPSEGEWEQEKKSAPEATKHIKTSVKKDPQIKGSKAKEGDLDDAVKHAPEAKKHKSGNETTAKGMQTAKPKEDNWEETNITHAPEAKKHIHLKETEQQEEGWMKNEEVEDESIVDETFDIESAEYMNEDFSDEIGDDTDDTPELDDNDDSDTEETDDSNWGGEEETTSDEPEAITPTDDTPELDDNDDDSDDVEISSTPSTLDDEGFKLLSNGKGEFKITFKGETFDVPNDEIYTSIAMDKTLKSFDRAEKIYDEMKKYGDL